VRIRSRQSRSGAPIGKGEISLPLGISGILLCELLPDGKVVAVILECAGLIVLGAQHVADFFVADAETILPIGIGGILFGELLQNGKFVAVALERPA